MENLHSFAWSPYLFPTDHRDLSKKELILHFTSWSQMFFSLVLNSNLILWWDLGMVLLALAIKTSALCPQVHNGNR